MGTIIMFAGNFAPKGWALCNGQIMSIASNSALFSILGTTYGGDGVSTFALPDLGGRVPVGTGAGPGLTNRPLGQKSGEESVTLTSAQMPSHNHALAANLDGQTQTDPTGQYLTKVEVYSPDAPSVNLGAQAIGQTGGNQSHDNMQPFLAMNYIIATEGIYPSRP